MYSKRHVLYYLKRSLCSSRAASNLLFKLVMEGGGG